MLEQPERQAQEDTSTIDFLPVRGKDWVRVKFNLVKEPTPSKVTCYLVSINRPVSYSKKISCRWLQWL